MINNIQIGLMVIAKMVWIMSGCLIPVVLCLMAITHLRNDSSWLNKVLNKAGIKVNSF